MSLLMDALNKAEQAKRQSQATAVDADAAAASSETAATPALALELAPLTPTATPSAPHVATQAPPALPELPSDMEILDQEFLAHAAAAKPSAKGKKPPTLAPAAAAPIPAPAPAVISRQADAHEREAAQNLFAAKQLQPPAANRTFAMVIGLLTLVAIIGFGGYFWLQLQPGTGLALSAPPASTQTPPAPLLQTAQPVPPAQVIASAKSEVPSLPPSAPQWEVAAIAAKADVASTSNEPPSPIRISSAKLALNPSLARGYAAYLAGNYVAASNEYRQTLNSEPKNIDALHGMAAINLRQGQTDVAEEYYLQAIEADPKDALAQAGLIGLKGQIDPVQAETRLKILLATQPDLPFLNFTLGNLYASQNRWNEAQAAFFKAYRAEPDNPDTLFNLAVSLDQLHQPKLAQQYYLQALATAANRPASFDKAQVSARLRELQP